MKKIIFTDVPMKKQVYKFCYESDNKLLKSNDGYLFVVNSMLASVLKPKDDVKVVLVKKHDVEGNSDVNERALIDELNAVNGKIGAKIETVTIETPFIETRIEHEKLLRKMIGELEEDCEIYADITFGAKPLPIIMLSVLSFASKFFNANIKNIIYGKVDFLSKEDGTTTAANPVLYDVTPLFYLNSITNTIDSKNSKDAVKILDLILSE